MLVSANLARGCRALFCCAALGILCSSSGCGVAKNAEKAARNSAERDHVKTALQAFGKLYHNFHDTNQRGPNDAQELEAYAARSGSAQVVQTVQQLGCEVAWGTARYGFSMGTHLYILAHRPQDLQDDGGYVLFLSGAVEFLPADQIRQKLEQREKFRNSQPAAASATPAAANPAGPGAAPSGSTPP